MYWSIAFFAPVWLSIVAAFATSSLARAVQRSAMDCLPAKRIRLRAKTGSEIVVDLVFNSAIDSTSPNLEAWEGK